jgi:hypothetical protein
VTLLTTRSQLEERKRVASAELAPLARGLRWELAQFVESPPEVPREKALLSRPGGRCAIDGTLLRYDPYDARHICPVCGREYAGGLHDRLRLYWHQLWIAERVLHAALLGVLLDDTHCRNAASNMLGQLSDQYLRYPNVDNVLGPSRPFFSTYLESIWLLQLSLALDILEDGDPTPETMSLGARVRDHLIAPSVTLIASYDEGMSNRQVWNNAAIMAASRLLDDRVRFDQALHGKSGLLAHLDRALLSDGSWYEGENYHLFAHRGLWYGVRLAGIAGFHLSPQLADRMHEGFVAPFRTLLPDLTYPARRDSQYAVSVRQPRFAESCELGLAGRDDERLTGILARLYDPTVPRSSTGRASSSADVERNGPPTGLSRADLSWRALLCARPELPPLVAQPFASDLLPAQGIGVLRREAGALYVSLDYGESGGGHGHPDRLNLTLADGGHRWFDDPGTGSYVDPSLHWYRSTLAHNAPLIDGHSQPRVNGELLAFADDGETGWVSARAQLAQDTVLTRTVVLLKDYLIDELSWKGANPHEIGLPMHGVTPAGRRSRPSGALSGGTAAEDGFIYLSDIQRLSMPSGALMMQGTDDGGMLDGWVFAPHGTTAMVASAPPPPGKSGTRPLVLVRHVAATGSYVTVWSWRSAVTSVEREDHALVVHRRDGTSQRHVRTDSGWQVATETSRGVERRSVETTVPVEAEAPVEMPSRSVVQSPAIRLPATLELGEAHYRRSEFTWQGAGAPRAAVTVTRPTLGTVLVEIEVPSSQRLFVPLLTENQLDNDPPSIHGDSVQLYALCGDRDAGLLLVPEGGHVAMRPVEGWKNELSVDARWRPTASGYRIDATLHIDYRVPEFYLDVLVNEIVPGRARRRGQLVMSGASGEFVYLRGDRHDPARLLRFALPNV